MFVCKQKAADEVRMSDWSSDVCSSDLTTDDERRLDPRLTAFAHGVPMLPGILARTDEHAHAVPRLRLAAIIADIDPAAVGILGYPIRRGGIDRKSTRLNSSH